MKNKILTFIIGVLVGAIIATAGFFIYEKVNNNNSSMPSGEKPQMTESENGETPPEKPDGEQDQSSGAPSEKPDGEQGQNSNSAPSEMPSKSNSNTSSESNS